MADWLERHPLASLIAIATAIVGLMLLIGLGGQTSRILSTVGSSVSDVGSGIGEQAPAATSAANASGTARGTATGTGAGAAALAPAPGLLIVRTGTLDLAATDVGAVLERAASITTSAGGYVAASKETGTSAADTGASIDLRIPATRWDATLRALRALGTVRGQEIRTDEVTGQVVDLDARVTNLRATEAALQAIMAKATRIDDILDVQGQLTTVRGEIEELMAKAASLRDRAAFGSLTLAVSAPAAPRPSATPKPGWDPGRDAAAATAKLVRIGQRATTAGIWFAIVGLPILVALAIGLGLLRLAWVAARRIGLIGAEGPV